MLEVAGEEQINLLELDPQVAVMVELMSAL
jgi:hypothetical protein